MTENLAGRGEGLAGLRSVDQDYIRNIREWKRSGKVDLAEIEELVLNMAAALEAAAPPSTPSKRDYYHEAIERVLEMRKLDLEHAKTPPAHLSWPVRTTAEHEREYYLGRAHRCDDILFWLGHIEANIPAGKEAAAALATPSPQAPLSECKNLDCPVGCPDSHTLNFDPDAAATQEPAGSGALLCDICGEPMLANSPANTWVDERCLRELQERAATPSPRKVGEDGADGARELSRLRGAQTFEQWWQAEGVHMVRTTHRTGYELMREAWNAVLVRPSSVPVGEPRPVCICAQGVMKCPRHGEQPAHREPCPLCGAPLGYCAEGEYCTKEDCKYVA